ncbi:cell division protein FtsK [Alkalihalobacillus alcalophilus ATCC 27647 = CGMCC 1.3604]|uniref:Cell division protein FtsK n=1 Tax=Alkalihalobacillus alcalophilus ATCC 27647 = CGMCC 1.3604 TaxID=1218173 RepID=A0A094XIC5_ALKAL|nr:DNA translocase FtsK [Alkalihalobacillus alcalophilus]KGA98540.1 cell division protein FtsK [Alkalihalobacillus alcalophilus ATCC 27647 = CGMCC 1.3604]
MLWQKEKKEKTQWKSQLTYELIGLGLLVIAVVTLARLGSVGETFVSLFRFFLGEWFILLAAGLLVLALYVIFKREMPTFWSRRMAGIYVMMTSFALFSHIGLFRNLGYREGFTDQSVIRNTFRLYSMEIRGEAPASGDLGGGMIGSIVFAVSHFLFAESGSYFLCFILFIVGLILITGKSFTEFAASGFRKSYVYLTDSFNNFIRDGKLWKEQTKEKLAEERENQRKKKADKKAKMKDELKQTSELDESPEPEIVDFAERAYSKSVEAKEQAELKTKQAEKNQDKHEESEHHETEEQPEVALMTTAIEENIDYQLPSFDLLQSPTLANQSSDRQRLTSNARKLEQTLESFGVKAKIMKVHLGPSVTKYEVNPSVGVKVSKIVNLVDDLALALAAKDIRIEAPIPGKSAIGIEVPNQEVAIVTLREVLDSDKSKEDTNVLSVALGRDISGEPVLAPLNKMPHLLVAGATGSGKSVCINGIITSILLKAKPHEVKLMMIDPKMVELNMYNGIPHLLTPVVTEPKKASQALKKVVAEMERRYDLFSNSGTRNIEGYNEYIRRANEGQQAKQPFLPYIVVIVDELADLMMVASGDVEDSIARLAQMARASGIHMIIATQRPSVDVITGVIKANIPSRIAFGVSSQVDSRTIIDSAGAEKLLGRGDMLYLPVGATKPTRVQGAFLSDDEVEGVVSYVISQQKAQYIEEMTPSEEVQTTNHEETDDLYEDAVELVTEMNTASVSMIQRRFRVGYARAARIIDQMEERGVVGPYEGSKPREVLVAKKNDEEQSS